MNRYPVKLTPHDCGPDDVLDALQTHEARSIFYLAFRLFSINSDVLVSCYKIVYFMAYTLAMGTRYAKLPGKIRRTVVYTENLECGVN